MNIMKQENRKIFEISALIFIYITLFFNAFYFKDSITALISAFFGITYTILAGKGRPVCYIFGLIGSGFYVYLAFKNALWGNLLLYAGYYIPMQILGFFRWNKHLKSNKAEIIKIHLGNKERIKIFFITLILTLAAIIILIYTKDKSPYIDGITTIFSIAGMYLTVKRAVEQWVVWMFVNGLSAFMWLKIALGGEKVLSTVIMWSVYFILAIYFYIIWKQEFQKQI